MDGGLPSYRHHLQIEVPHHRDPIQGFDTMPHQLFHPQRQRCRGLSEDLDDGLWPRRNVAWEANFYRVGSSVLHASPRCRLLCVVRRRASDYLEQSQVTAAVNTRSQSTSVSSPSLAATHRLTSLSSLTSVRPARPRSCRTPLHRQSGKTWGSF